MSGYTPMGRGAKVEFLRRGVWQPGTVVAVILDPNRRPGIGRVSYEVKTGPQFHPIRIAAKNVRAADEVAP